MSKQGSLSFSSEPKEPIYTVSELTLNIKKILEQNFPGIWVEGEISNIKKPTSGHIYFTLKDAKSQLPVVIFRDLTPTIRFELKDGLKVLVGGRVSVYQTRGQYQLYADRIEPRGKGALQLAFEQLKEKLDKEGLFSPEHKKGLPLFPHQIGVVTSPTGAAIRDILKVIFRRFPKMHVILYPVRVQGEGAALEIAQAIDDFNQMDEVEVLIVGRGGGSLEDLWAFNEEVVARAIYRSKIPLISAVGHEIDYCIADLVADRRAPTPSAAAELVVGVAEEVQEKISTFQESMERVLRDNLQFYKQKLTYLEESYGLKSMRDKIGEFHLRIDELEGKFISEIAHVLQMKEGAFLRVCSQLESLSPLAVLKRGYSITYKLPQRDILQSSREVSRKDEVEVKLYEGKIICEVKNV